MDDIFKDLTKIKAFSQIQKSLFSLNINSTEKEFDNFIKQIPQEFLTQKDDLMTLCQLIGYSVRCGVQPRKNVIRIFQRIIIPIKTHLQNESSFFWNIFGGHFYFKLWMYEEGLISMTQIISNCQNDSSGRTSEYFSPEISSVEPEIFDKEIKHRIKHPISEKQIEEFREKRSKHIQWLLNSSDYNDPLYLEIESNPIRLAVKTDNVELFQRYLSNTNFSVNSKIIESVFDSYNRFQTEVSLLDYAARYSSLSIFKFLLLNGAVIDDDVIYDVVRSRNYDIIHITEREESELFGRLSLFSSIQSWGEDITSYLIDNYNFDFLEKSEVDSAKDEVVLSIAFNTFYSLNFIFFESTLLPFMLRNQRFVKDNINKIAYNTFYDWSCFFLKELVKCPHFDVNHVFVDENMKETFLASSITKMNPKAAELITNNSNYVHVDPCYKFFSAFQLVARLNSDMKFVEIIRRQPNFDVNWKDERYHVTSFQLAVTNGNIELTKYIIENFTEKDLGPFEVLFFYCLKTNHLMTLKLVLKHYLSKRPEMECEKIMENIKINFSFDPNYRSDFADVFKSVYHELENDN